MLTDLIFKVWGLLEGKKTYVGSILMFVVIGAEGMGWIPSEVAAWLKGLCALLIGVGVGHKIDRK